jgi:hypothetical protein
MRARELSNLRPKCVDANDCGTIAPMLDDGSVVDHPSTWGSIGGTGRTARPGPEKELVERFLATVPLRAAAGCEHITFREPRLDSGFPDIVVVAWHAATAREWPRARTQLRRDDLRIAQLLVSLGSADDAQIQQFWPRLPRGSLARLEAAELIERHDSRWRTRSLARVFAVRRIYAFEAKIADWRDAIAQAALNRWFATDSFVVLPRVPNGADVVAEARARGVGLWVQHDRGPVCRARPPSAPAPLSYASWLFNEWCWRLTSTDGQG